MLHSSPPLKAKRSASNFVKVAREEEYSKFLSEAREVSPDPDDVDFFALALRLGCPLWSEDKLLKQQSKVKVLSTHDLIELLGL